MFAHLIHHARSMIDQTEALTCCQADTLLGVGRVYASSSISTKPSFDIFVNLMKHSVMHHQHHHAYFTSHMIDMIMSVTLHVSD